MKKTKITIHPSFCLLLLVFALIDAQMLVVNVLFAAALHEFGHFAALKVVGARVKSFKITLWGGEIKTDGREMLSYGKEIFAITAGPCVNIIFALLLGASGAYMLSGIHAVLGIFNLLPIRPLDGGRIMELSLSEIFDPILADRAIHYCTVVTASLLLLIIFSVILKTGIWLTLLIMAYWLGFTLVKEVGIVKKVKTV